MVDDAVDSHPLWLDAKPVVLLLHLSIVRVLHLALVTLPVILTRAIVQGWRLIHVIFPLVVAIHYQVEDLQLREQRGMEKRQRPNSKRQRAAGKSCREGIFESKWIKNKE